MKLRNGGVVDSDDIRQGLLVRRFLSKAGRRSFDEEDGAEGGPTSPAQNGRAWGARGISLSADDGVRENGNKKKAEREQGLTDPRAFEDDDYDDDPDLGPEEEDSGHDRAIGNGSEWREGSSK